MVYILTYRENSDERCTAESYIFGSEAEAIGEMQSAFEEKKALFGGEFGTEEDECKYMEKQRWASMVDSSAHIQVGIDSYDWDITSDNRFAPIEEPKKGFILCRVDSYVSAITTHSQYFDSLEAAQAQMKDEYSRSKDLLGGSFDDERDDDLSDETEQRWARISDMSAHIQTGLDCNHWDITMVDRPNAEKDKAADADSADVLYIVSGCTKNGENGDMIPVTPKTFSDKEEAKGYLRQRYEDELKELDLDDNEACNDEGDSIPGGCLESDGTCAQIWNITDCSFGALENVAIFILTEVAAEAKSATDTKSMSDVIQKLKGAAEKMEGSANAHQDQGCYNAAWEHGYVKATYDAIKAIQQ